MPSDQSNGLTNGYWGPARRNDAPGHSADEAGDQEMPRCDVVGCGKAADVEVILYDVYPDVPTVFFQRDYTCSFLCYEHMVENEKGADGVRRPGGLVIYPYTNRHRARGFTIYRPLPEDD